MAPTALPRVTYSTNTGSSEYPSGKIFFAGGAFVRYTPLIPGFYVWGHTNARYIQSAVQYLTRKGIWPPHEEEKPADGAGARLRAGSGGYHRA